jgi:hypothetical protein
VQLAEWLHIRGNRVFSRLPQNGDAKNHWIAILPTTVTVNTGKRVQ